MRDGALPCKTGTSVKVYACYKSRLNIPQSPEVGQRHCAQLHAHGTVCHLFLGSGGLRAALLLLAPLPGDKTHPCLSAKSFKETQIAPSHASAVASLQKSRRRWQHLEMLAAEVLL